MGEESDKPLTLPEPFWDSMSPESKEVIRKLEDRGLTLYATGSRVICPAHTRIDSDWDVFCFSDERPVLEGIWLLANGFNGFKSHEDKSGGFGARSVYHGKINLILVYDKHLLQAWKDATDFCVSIGGPVTRDKRIKVFKSLGVY